MENQNNNISRHFAPLFIQEDDASFEAVGENSELRYPAQSEQIFIGEFLDQTMSIAQYLKEMDDVLKSSEEMTGITDISGSQEYMSTSSIDTQESISEVRSQCTSFDSCVEEANASSTSLTLTGKNLSESMVEYEGQLVHILDMLESSVEDSNRDSKPQDSYDEYVHISKIFKKTAKIPVEPSKAMVLGAQEAVITLCDHQDSSAGEDHLRKIATRALTQSACPFDNSRSCHKDSHMHNTAHVQDEQKKVCTEEGEDISITDPLNEAKVDMAGLNLDVSDFEILGPKLDQCIDEVKCLMQRRKKLLAQMIELHGYCQEGEPKETSEQGEHMDQTDTIVAELITKLKKEEQLRREMSQSEIENLRQEQAEEERKLWRVSLERQGLHIELWRLKRKLFVIAKDCAQRQAALSAQQRHMELLKNEKEKLQKTEVQLREDNNKLKQEHQQQLVSLQEKLNVATSSLLKNTQELAQCRKDSCNDVQKYQQDSLKLLEERYGPILIALLKRRDTAVDACAKVKEQAQELRVQLTPLREEVQKLTLQKVCLEEKNKLLAFQRKEKMGQYKEIVDSLEESCRELKTELRIQKAKISDMKELKDILNEKLTTYRSATDNHVNKETT